MTEQEIADMKSALEAAQASIANLEAVNKNLKKEKTDAKAAADAAEEAREEAAREAAEQSGNVETVRAALEAKHKKDLKAVQDKLEASNTQLTNLLIDGEITKSLVANVKDTFHHEALSAYLKMNTKLENGVAMRGDMTLEDSLNDYFTNGAGKNYVTAPSTVGTGATGARTTSTNQWNTKPSTPEEHFKFAKLSKEDPALYDSLRAKFGMTDK